LNKEDFAFTKFASNLFYKEQNAHLVDMADLESGQRVVDLACGTGGVTRLITEHLKGARKSAVIGIDHSSTALKQAMEDLKDVKDSALEFIQSRVEQISDTVTDSVDAVFFCNAIHYISDKESLLSDISKTLKPGGKLVFNTSFYDGAHPPETMLFARKWMMRASRILRAEHGLRPRKLEKVQSRKQLTPIEYKTLLEQSGFQITKQEIAKVQVTLQGWQDISSFEDFILGVMPGVPLEKASAALKEAVAQVFEEMGVRSVPRNWLDIVATKA
jgi:ubiquinone/menaquinone biosynthesis C-methylase UbiE